MGLSRVSCSMMIAKKVAYTATFVTTLRWIQEYCFCEGKKTRKIVANLDFRQEKHCGSALLFM
jgi:hypothetical protein